MINALLTKRILLFHRYFNLFLFSLFLFSCSGTQVPFQTGVATQGGKIDMSQTNIQNNYFQAVKRDGSATGLISNANNIADLQSLLGQINREASLGLGKWEKQLRSYYQKYYSDPTSEVENAISSTKNKLREIQRTCAEKIAKNDITNLKSELFLLDGLASEIAGKIGLSRPLSK